MVKGRQKLIQMLRPLLRLLLMLNQMLIQASPDAHPPIPPPDSVHKTPVQVKPQSAMMFLSNTVKMFLHIHPDELHKRCAQSMLMLPQLRIVMRFSPQIAIKQHRL